MLDTPDPDFLTLPQEQVAKIEPLEDDGKDDAANNGGGAARPAHKKNFFKTQFDTGCRQQ